MTRKFLRPALFTRCLTFLLIILSLSALTWAQSANAPAQGETAAALTAAAPEKPAPEQNVTVGAAETKDSNAKHSKDSVSKDADAAAEATPTPSLTPEMSDPAASALIEPEAMSDAPPAPAPVQEVAPNECRETIKADVVALDQPYMLNRLGATMPQGMIFALRRDVVPSSLGIDTNGNDVAGSVGNLQAGKVRLRSGKRARPIVLRLNLKDCLEITFTNLLNPTSTTTSTVKTRNAGLHIQGLNLFSRSLIGAGPGIDSDSSFVGVNPAVPPCNPGSTCTNIGSFAAPGRTLVYKYYAAEEGTFMISSGAGDETGQLQAGLFGAVNVEPEGAEYYRSQVTREDLQLATFTDDDLPNNDRVHMFLTPKLNAQRVQERAVVEDQPRDLYTLTTVNKLKQTVQTATVIKVPVTVTVGSWSYGPKNYLYVWEPNDANSNSADAIGHPVINYNALYPSNYPVAGRPCTPVLMMVRMTDVQHPCDEDHKKPEDKPLGERREYILYHTDLTAVITGPNADRFPYTNTSPTFRNNPATPDRRQPYREFTIHYHNPSVPVQAFTQWSSSYPDPQLRTSYNAVRDLFAINYGTGGIGAEIVSNRLGVGPAGGLDAVEMKFEEFFLSAWAVGDPAMVVDKPANYTPSTSAPPCNPLTLPPGGKCVTQVATNPPPGPKATKAFYPDDPSNVYHSYMGDHTKFRVLHAGTGANHVHHLHAHQWLHSPNNDNSSYLDSQMINPGSAYTMEIVYNGSGNRNKTVGDSIFHCHFYPHFAQGMWAMWRVHDVFEAGTKLDAAGRPVVTTDPANPVWNRALPDAEISAGTPIPAIVPLPTIGMAPIPAKVRLTVKNDPDPSVKVPDAVWTKLKAIWGSSTNVPDQWMSGRRVVVKTSSTDPAPLYTRNPGFPFFIPGIAGHRPPHPPMDFGWAETEPGKPDLNADGSKKYLDGGLPRHIVLGGQIFREFHTRWDFTKDFVLYDEHKARTAANNYGMIDGALVAFQLPENGTAIEEAAMRAHARRAHPTVLPDGDPGNFILNGLPPAPGAPYSDPSVDDNGNSTINTRRYKAAAIQTDTVFNKKGWHYPQQRMIALLNDAADIYRGVKPPEPFFFRSNTGETIEFWHTNLVPNYYEMDDFQVRTPTDIIGQHIHLVKFDVTSSDGAANGFNYEDGTFSSDEVRERIFAVNQEGGLYQFDPLAQFVSSTQKQLTIKTFAQSYAAYVPPGFTPPPDWDGAQTTIQRFDTDPLLNNEGVDRTLRTVFTHDHYGPSTHQQAGLYGGMLIEPEGSKWFDATTGRQLYDTNSKRADGTLLRDDGGPTTWQAVIVTANQSESYREFALEFQDMALAYTAASVSKPTVPASTFFPFTFSNASSGPNANYATNVQTELNASPSGTAPTPGTCPTTLGTPNVGANTKAAFGNSGVTLSSKAFAIKTSTGWSVINPEPQPSTACDLYNITQTGSGTSLKLPVANPTMHASWADSANVISAPGSNISPTVISPTNNSGTYSVNYRNEPLPLRVGTAGSSPQATDLAYAFSSMARGDTSLNSQPSSSQLINPGCTGAGCFKFPKNQLIAGCNPNAGTTAATAASSGCPQGTDPYTPLLRAYAGDRVQIRTLVGAHLVGHPLRLHGFRWHPEPSISNSGFVAAQGMGISEHFEMLFDVPTLPAGGQNSFADYLYEPSGGADGLVNGVWGIFRAYTQPAPNLLALPDNRVPKASPLANVSCPTDSRQRTYNVTAVSAAKALPGGQLVYNSRGQAFNGSTTPPAQGFNQTFPLADPNALLYVRNEDLNTDGTLKAGVPIEPLILRAHAGECINVVLRNCLGTTPCGGTTPQTLVSYKANAFINSPFGRAGLSSVNPTLNASTSVGLSPQLLTSNITSSGDTNIGFNSTQTVAPGASATYQWYAGTIAADGTATPVEFGAVNLLPADPLMQDITGLVGALIIEPADSTFVEDASTRAAATIMKKDGTSFREMVLVFQNNIQTQQMVAPLFAAFNYRSEFMGYRYPVAAPVTASNLGSGGFPGGDSTAKVSNWLISNLSSATPADPQTPVFSAAAGTPVRFHVLFGGGYNQMEVFDLHGHSWQEQPFVNDSTQIGFNPLSQNYGGYLMWPFQASNIVLAQAGGRQGTAGDYLYSSFNDLGNNGTWGIFRVRKEVAVIQKAVVDEQSHEVAVSGAYMVQNGMTTRPTITVYAVPAGGGAPRALGPGVTVGADGTWSFSVNTTKVQAGTTVIALSSNSPAACTADRMQDPSNGCITSRAQVQATGDERRESTQSRGGSGSGNAVGGGGGGGTQKR
ncbi:MAG: hypothetical protein JOZ96_04750 [Acidobacteria bacterium]|nr:hypothetical protein [Acidobacteriota bacterium]